jgi:hypothetical protein
MCNLYVIKIIDKYFLLKMLAIFFRNKWGITPLAMENNSSDTSFFHEWTPLRQELGAPYNATSRKLRRIPTSWLGRAIIMGINLKANFGNISQQASRYYILRFAG